MNCLKQASELRARGKFIDALRVLDSRKEDGEDRQASEALRADLLEQVGRHVHAKASAEGLLRSKILPPSLRSACELVLARLDRESGDLPSAIQRLERSVGFAIQGNDLESTCWSQLRLMLVLAESSGPEAISGILADVRSNTLKLGSPQVTAALHIFVGSMETKRGLIGSGAWHTRLGLQLLPSNPNVWLETDAAITNVALAIMRSDFEGGLVHAKRAVQLAELSGRAAARRASLANLGNLLYLTGQFDEAIDHYYRAMDALPSSGEFASGALDGIAQIELVRGRVNEAATLLERAAEWVRSPRDRHVYSYRHNQLTYTQLLVRRGEWNAALESADALLHLAGQSGDHLLHKQALLTKAELLQQTGDVAGAMATLDVVVQTLPQQPPDLFAHYERILACILLDAGDRDSATSHLRRARRLYESIRNAPGLMELSRRWDETATRCAERTSTTEPLSPSGASAPVTVARDVLQTIAGLLRHHSRPELLARELAHLLAETDCVGEARALSIGDDAPQVLATATGPGGPAADGLERRISLGFARERAVELELKVRPHIDALATVNAVILLLATIQDLERARAEREERISLWPADDDVEDGGAIVGGQMRTLIANARRIASTNASVFITGESGTGKEILARAIHRFSDRAAKPFIPFNCAAVPRDTIESQLFGHRRGSFTGADRDHPGMIGAARDGTLFLDEIGDLSLDLQPKLLRFLESSEICPVGESTPFTINVRVVAATNANVEQQVKDGRFREDLFYRLNVIRLKIPPLRERRDEIPALVRHFLALSAGEFRKGDVRLSDEAMEHLLLCRWPGNVRQLQNEIRRMVVMAEPNASLTPRELSDDVFNTRLAARPEPNEFEMLVPLKEKLQPTVSKVERAMIRLALRDHHNNLDAAARTLGISRKGLYLKRQRLGL